MIPSEQLSVTEQMQVDLGDDGIEVAAQRLSTYGADCLTCGRPLGQQPVSLSLTRYDTHDLVAVAARHASCGTPEHQVEWTYLITGIAMGDAPLLVVHPSLEQVWLQPRRSGIRKKVRGWVDTTATAFRDLGFVPGASNRRGPLFPSEPIPNAGLYVDGDVLKIHLPPYDTWTVAQNPDLLATIRMVGGAFVVISTLTDHQGELHGELMTMLRSNDYVIGWLPLSDAPRESQSLQTPFRSHHPLMRSSPSSAVCRATFADDPALDRIFQLATREGPRIAGIDTDRFPVLLFEHLYAMVTDDGRWPLVEYLAEAGLPRVDWAHDERAPVLDGWRLTLQQGEAHLTGPDGRSYARGEITPEPEWLSAAVGHGYVCVLVGALLGVRDRPDADEARNELDAAGQQGLVLGGVATFQRG